MAEVDIVIEKGDPTPEELAALVAALAVVSGAREPAGGEPPAPPVLGPRVSDPLRGPVRPGPAAWTARPARSASPDPRAA